MIAVGHGQHGLEPAQDAVGAPVLGQLDRRAHEVALMLFELGLETLNQREGIGRGACEAGEHLVVMELAHLARRALDDEVAQGDLTVAADRDLPVTVRHAPAHADDGGSVKLIHRG